MKQAYPPFVTGSLRLRLLDEADLPSTLAWRNRDGARQQFGTADVLQWDQHAGWFTRYLDKADDLVFIVEDAATHSRIGQVAIYGIDAGASKAEIGRFVVAPEFQGQGLMRQGIEALMRFARPKLSDLRRCICWCATPTSAPGASMCSLVSPRSRAPTA